MLMRVENKTSEWFRSLVACKRRIEKKQSSDYALLDKNKD